jgi:glutaredoxin
MEHRLIILYTRPGCHLCETVEELLDMLSEEQPMTITLVNILDTPELYERYKWAIPVVVIADGPTLAAPIEERELRNALGM